MARPIGMLLLLGTLSVVSVGCGTASITPARQVGGVPSAAPTIVYVRDFELDAANVRSQRGLLPPLPPPPPGLGSLLPPPPGAPVDPAVRARQIVELMSKSLVKDLSEKHVIARRLAPHEPMPTGGWLVRGVFTNVQQGNQFQRAAIGFGAGQTELQAVVAIDDLSLGAPKPMYEADARADSGKMPGAVITLNPYVAAARFVMSSKDLDRNVERTATQIADEVARRLGEARQAQR